MTDEEVRYSLEVFRQRGGLYVEMSHTTLEDASERELELLVRDAKLLLAGLEAELLKRQSPEPLQS